MHCYAYVDMLQCGGVGWWVVGWSRGYHVLKPLDRELPLDTGFGLRQCHVQRYQWLESLELKSGKSWEIFF